MKEPVTVKLITGHLEGRYSLGAHPIGEKGECRWMGWEVYSAATLPPLRRRVTNMFPENATLIHTTGGRSYHIKVFFKYPIRSEDAYWLARHIAEGLRGVEFFPKQPSVGRGYRNFMRVPLGSIGRQAHRSAYTA